MIGELRSDHAGETGAVMIYRGILAVATDPETRDFATRHLATEREHLSLIEDVLPAHERSMLLPLWRVAGWITGALPAVFGPTAVYRTIEAVETFVDRHYAAQIAMLPPGDELRQLLERCRDDEISHRDEAAARSERPASAWLRGWAWIVGQGSAAAVTAARRM